MIEQVTKCDICRDLANVPLRAEGDANILINTHDGHGDYAFRVVGGVHIDLCQKHLDEVFKLLTILFGQPTPEKPQA